MGRLEGKVAFITGAGAGIARAAAELFSKEGARIALIEINEETGSSSEQALREQGRQALFIRADVTKEDSVVAAVGKAVERFGKITGAAIPADGGRSAY